MNSSTICVDASLVVPLVVGGAKAARIAELWSAWHEAGSVLLAPTLIFYEVTNALRRYVVQGELLPAEAREALQLATDLHITLYGDPRLHQRALKLAEDLSLPAAYDAHYLALAERSEAEFWTADRRLVQAVRSVFPWVYLLT